MVSNILCPEFQSSLNRKFQPPFNFFLVPNHNYLLKVCKTVRIPTLVHKTSLHLSLKCTKMLSSFVGWIMPSSSSSSSSQYDDEEDDDNTENDSISSKTFHNADNDIINEENDVVLTDAEDDESISNPNIPVGIAVTDASATTVTIALPAAKAPISNPPITTTTTTMIGNSKRRRFKNENDAWAMQDEKKPVDDSRRQFHRRWTNEDEIELLRGFLEYTTQRGTTHYNDTKLFYDQIRSKLQVEFNKNQLFDKLRRLKKKFKNVFDKTSSDKEFSFKTAHEQSTFEISLKIWGDGIGHLGVEDNMLDEDESSPNLNNLNNLVNVKVENEEFVGDSRPWKRIKPWLGSKRVSNNGALPNDNNSGNNIDNNGNNVASLIEETVKSCLSPLFQELLNNALSPMPTSLDGVSLINLKSGEEVDEKWREQRIMELEVYSKRLELVQGQIKAALEELRSMGG
jgi:hypothetical protein